jgi:hypothetical protein
LHRSNPLKLLHNTVLGKVNDMNEVKYLKFVETGLVLLVLLFCFISHSFAADDSLSSAIDCSSIKINYIDRPDMTQSERLEAMNKAFFESVNQFELCNLSSQAQSSPESESISENQVISESAEESDDSSAESGEVAQESVASPTMVGTELESTASTFDTSEETSMQDTGNESSIAAYGSGKNGKIPEDIPDVNNDDAIAAQIRLAAEIEDDPVKKEKLWNEYRKYKGLAVKKND